MMLMTQIIFQMINGDINNGFNILIAISGNLLTHITMQKEYNALK